MELQNCRNCKKLFENYNKDNKICPVCKKIEDNQFDTIRTYLERYPLSTLLQVSQGTGLLPKTIVKFIRMGRLMVVENSPIQVECLKCGQPIRSGNYCSKCATEFRKNLNVMHIEKEQSNNMELSEQKAMMHYTRNKKVYH